MAYTILRPSLAWNRLGCSKSTGYLRVQQQLLPPPVSLGPQRGGRASMVGWPESEIDAINAARIAGKSDEEIRQLVKRLLAERQALGPKAKAPPIAHGPRR